MPISVDSMTRNNEHVLGVVVDVVGRINEVNQHRARLVRHG